MSIYDLIGRIPSSVMRGRMREEDFYSVINDYLECSISKDEILESLIPVQEVIEGIKSLVDWNQSEGKSIWTALDRKTIQNDLTEATKQLDKLVNKL
jgi:hypothetical protein